MRRLGTARTLAIWALLALTAVLLFGADRAKAAGCNAHGLFSERVVRERGCGYIEEMVQRNHERFGPGSAENRAVERTHGLRGTENDPYAVAEARRPDTGGDGAMPGAEVDFDKAVAQAKRQNRTSRKDVAYREMVLWTGHACRARAAGNKHEERVGWKQAAIWGRQYAWYYPIGLKGCPA